MGAVGKPSAAFDDVCDVSGRCVRSVALEPLVGCLCVTSVRRGPIEHSAFLFRGADASVPFDIRQKFGKRQPKALCHGRHGLDRQVAFTTLDSAHVRPVQTAVVGKRFLRKARLRHEVLALERPALFEVQSPSNSLEIDGLNVYRLVN